MDNSSLSHTKWDCTYPIVFIPKYRRKVMYGEVRSDIREIIKKLCEYKEVKIVEGSVCVDHIHLCVKIPPKLSVSQFMGYPKGKRALMIFDRHPEYKKRGDRHFWAKGYYVNTVGRNEAEIRKYIQNQVEADQLEDKKQE
ncbi:IS200/IS605 family transposase [Paenibacillus sp. J2TS4]|uniref:IS200/IS605 family transposase n=1 Tax=Paenibacillus sp. J2TS4 TaxID=2807194 RepID=UPI001B09A2CC|nr:IS200/IS605 family transposase [Paenibacillus sp. J2TS4]GIP31666.1 IS200/IS605 family transposase [Paenibacillus sp. J2TS4]